MREKEMKGGKKVREGEINRSLSALFCTDSFAQTPFFFVIRSATERVNLARKCFCIRLISQRGFRRLESCKNILEEFFNPKFLIDVVLSRLT